VRLALMMLRRLCLVMVPRRAETYSIGPKIELDFRINTKHSFKELGVG